MSITPSLYTKARSEILALFAWNADSLTPEQMLRIDCAIALRLALDDLQGRIVRGESIDVTRMLNASEALSRLLPPTALATPPAESREDPRQAMWLIYKQMRERGELNLRPLPLEGDSQRRIAELEAELAALKGGSVPALLPLSGTSSPMAALPDVIDPPTSAIVPPSERAECDAGHRAGPDDRPRRPPPVIEAKAVPNPPAASAAPKYDYDKEQGWKDYVLPDSSISPMGAGGDGGDQCR
jgi:hypothetical protein